MTSLFSYAEAKAARDQAIGQVTANNLEWNAIAFIEFQELARGSRFKSTHPVFTAEQIRRELTPLVGHPSHSNAWGGFTRKIIKAGLIVETGKWVQTADVKSH